MTHEAPRRQEVLAAVARAVPSFSPAAVQRLRFRPGKADIYWVRGVGSLSLVLKLQEHQVCALEERVYLQVLAQLPVPAIRCHGTTHSPDPSRAWLVMEYADGIPFDRGSSAHTTSLARWLGVVHAGAARVAAPGDFPDHGAEYWHGIVAEARRTLQVGVDNPAVTRRDRGSLVLLAEVLDGVLGDWSEAERWMRALPGTLTHGDLVPHNLRMGELGAGRLPWVHDWGAAGWGCPMIDLLWVDLPTYAESLRTDWSGLALSTARELRALGAVCWTAFVLIPERENLSSSWPHRAAAKASIYLSQLARHGALSVAKVAS